KVGSPAEIEYKYDGFRMQIHKSKENTTIFTRRLENVTEQFPEVLEAVKNNVKSDSFIIDCEAVGFNPKTKKYMPFQNISQRIRRKYDIKKLSKELPVELNVFDVLFLDDKSIIKKTFKERRKLLEKLIKEEKRKIMIAKNLKTSNRKKALLFYKESLKKGNEGVILKSSDGVYKPGSRVGFMVKLKPSMNTFDLTIIGAEWGKGKRSGWLTSFSLACFDEGRFLPIGKVGTGIKEKAKQGTSFKELTELLKPHIIKEDGREASIKPEIVIEIRFEEIQKSTNYSSGFALRFPRFVRIRDDRSPEECSSFEMIKEAFKKQ
ncbi:DNA ligase, partial [Candidatus Woesearchaeota archaeon]|nr:DNA ligase [Candidatus Woesearchaeota archaeon]